jgi:hypothetical protein
MITTSEITPKQSNIIREYEHVTNWFGGNQGEEYDFELKLDI